MCLTEYYLGFQSDAIENVASAEYSASNAS